MPFLGARGRGTQEPKEWLVTKEWLVIKEWLVSCSTLSTAICSSRLILLQNESASDRCLCRSPTQLNSGHK